MRGSEQFEVIVEQWDWRQGKEYYLPRLQWGILWDSLFVSQRSMPTPSTFSDERSYLMRVAFSLSVRRTIGGLGILGVLGGTYASPPEAPQSWGLFVELTLEKAPRKKAFRRRPSPKALQHKTWVLLCWRWILQSLLGGRRASPPTGDPPPERATTSSLLPRSLLQHLPNPPALPPKRSPRETLPTPL